MGVGGLAFIAHLSPDGWGVVGREWWRAEAKVRGGESR